MTCVVGQAFQPDISLERLTYIDLDFFNEEGE